MGERNTRLTKRIIEDADYAGKYDLPFSAIDTVGYGISITANDNPKKPITFSIYGPYGGNGYKLSMSLLGLRSLHSVIGDVIRQKERRLDGD